MLMTFRGGALAAGLALALWVPRIEARPRARERSSVKVVDFTVDSLTTDGRLLSDAAGLGEEQVATNAVVVQFGFESGPDYEEIVKFELELRHQLGDRKSLSVARESRTAANDRHLFVFKPRTVWPQGKCEGVTAEVTATTERGVVKASKTLLLGRCDG